MKDIKQNDINNLSYKDIAYLILEKKGTGINTLDLFTEIVNKLNLPNNVIDTKIADFYTSLTTDKRFLMLDGLWDLRIHHTSDKVLTTPDEEEDDEEPSEDVEEDEDESFDDVEDIDDASYDEDDDGLSDLVVLDEDEIDLDN